MGLCVIQRDIIKRDILRSLSLPALIIEHFCQLECLQFFFHLDCSSYISHIFYKENRLCFIFGIKYFILHVISSTTMYMGRIFQMLYLFAPCGLLFWLCRKNDGFIQLLRKMPNRFTAVFAQSLGKSVPVKTVSVLVQWYNYCYCYLKQVC